MTGRDYRGQVTLAECDRGEHYINAAERKEPGNEPEVQSDRLAFEFYRRTRTPQSCSVLDKEDNYILF